MQWSKHFTIQLAQFSGTISYGKFPFLAARCTGESKEKFSQEASAPASRRMATLIDWKDITAMCRAVLPFPSCSKHNTGTKSTIQWTYTHVKRLTECYSGWSFEILSTLKSLCGQIKLMQLELNRCSPHH